MPWRRSVHLERQAACSLALLSSLCGAAPQPCINIDDDARRLACFDRLHGTPARGPTGGDGAAAAPGGAAVGATANPAGGAAAAAARPATGGLSSADARPDRQAFGGDAQPFELRPYRGIYVMPVSHTDNPNRRPTSPAAGHGVGVDLPNRALEAKFQLSARTLAWRGELGAPAELWIAYTQSSRWQVYQSAISRPFRETNYEPELTLNFAPRVSVLGWDARLLGFTLNHQSNGRALPLSRSWNRLVGELGLQRGDWSLHLRPWTRLAERAEKDDNPDIEDHVGRAELSVARHGDAGSVLQLRLRHSLRGGGRSRGSAEFDWAFPLTGRLQGYVQLFNGYGESLVDYNIRQSRIGLGFALAGWK